MSGRASPREPAGTVRAGGLPLDQERTATIVGLDQSTVKVLYGELTQTAGAMLRTAGATPRTAGAAAAPARAQTGNSMRATGAEVGRAEPPAGSTVMPTAEAPPGEPSNSTACAARWESISPAGRMVPESSNQSW